MKIVSGYLKIWFWILGERNEMFDIGKHQEGDIVVKPFCAYDVWLENGKAQRETEGEDWDKENYNSLGSGGERRN